MRLEEAVKALVAELEQTRHLAARAHAVDDVVALDPLRVERLDELGRILQVAVEQDARRRPSRGAMPLVKAFCEPKLRLCVMALMRGFAAASALEHALRVVGAAVVDEDDLVVDADLLEGRLEALGHDGHGLARPGSRR